MRCKLDSTENPHPFESVSTNELSALCPCAIVQRRRIRRLGYCFTVNLNDFVKTFRLTLTL